MWTSRGRAPTVAVAALAALDQAIRDVTPYMLDNCGIPGIS
jgi:hypothetical protein